MPIPTQYACVIAPYEKSFVRCGMTEEFPFLVTKMSPYYDR